MFELFTHCQVFICTSEQWVTGWKYCTSFLSHFIRGYTKHTQSVTKVVFLTYYIFLHCLGTLSMTCYAKFTYLSIYLLILQHPLARIMCRQDKAGIFLLSWCHTTTSYTQIKIDVILNLWTKKLWIYFNYM